MEIAPFCINLISQKYIYFTGGESSYFTHLGVFTEGQSAYITTYKQMLVCKKLSIVLIYFFLLHFGPFFPLKY